MKRVVFIQEHIFKIRRFDFHIKLYTERNLDVVTTIDEYSLEHEAFCKVLEPKNHHNVHVRLDSYNEAHINLKGLMDEGWKHEHMDKEGNIPIKHLLKKDEYNRIRNEEIRHSYRSSFYY